MEDPGFLVIDGLYDELIGRASLYVRPMGSETCFTVNSPIFRQEEFDRIIGKVIVVSYIEDDLASVRPTSTQKKNCLFFDPRDGKKLWGSGSRIILTGKYIDKVVEDDGYEEYIVDAIFLLKFGFTSGEGDLGRIGDWIELELTLEVFFDVVLTVEEWLDLNPDKK